MNVRSENGTGRFTLSAASGKRVVPILIALAIIVAVIWILAIHIRAVSFHDLRKAMSLIPISQIFQAVILTAVSFAGLAAYDILAVRAAAPGHAIMWRSAFAGATGNALSNTLGFHAITGAFARYRIYRSAGLERDTVAQVISLSWATLGLGVVSTLAGAMLWRPDRAMQIMALCPIIGLVAVLIWLSRRSRTLRIARFSIQLPSASLASLQMIVGAIEMSAAIGALYVLLPGDMVPTFPAFVGIYIGAVLLGIIIPWSAVQIRPLLPAGTMA